MKNNVDSFKLIMISAMYENGGNTLQRYLDGHPQLFVYPFESQLGTRQISDYLTSVFPQKYRWPQLSLSDTFDQDYEQIWDEELKHRVKTPQASKFQTANIILSDTERKSIFLDLLKGKTRSRRNIVQAFFQSTFLAWKNYKQSGQEKIYVGYSPVVVVDTEKIIQDFPDSKIIHIVRNPFSAYAETKSRPVPYNLDRYIHTWNIVQLFALNFAKLYPKQLIIVRFEDLVGDSHAFFNNLTNDLSLPFHKSLMYPSWNGNKLFNLYPWGTIQHPTAAYDKKKRHELDIKEREKIVKMSSLLINYFDYQTL